MPSQSRTQRKKLFFGGNLTDDKYSSPVVFCFSDFGKKMFIITTVKNSMFKNSVFLWMNNCFFKSRRITVFAYITLTESFPSRSLLMFTCEIYSGSAGAEKMETTFVNKMESEDGIIFFHRELFWGRWYIISVIIDPDSAVDKTKRTLSHNLLSEAPCSAIRWLGAMSPGAWHETYCDVWHLPPCSLCATMYIPLFTRQWEWENLEQ